MNGRPAAAAEDMTTDFGVLVPAEAQVVGMMGIPDGEVLVLGHDIHGYDMACACAVEAGRGVATTAVALREVARGVVAGAASRQIHIAAPAENLSPYSMSGYLGVVDGMPK